MELKIRRKMGILSLFALLKGAGVKKITYSVLVFPLLCCFSLAENVDTEKLETDRVESGDGIIWRQIAPGNAGFANMIRYHPKIAGKVMMCPDMWNAYQSDTNGKKWYGITDCDGNGSFNHLRDLVYSASDINLAIATSGGILWKSTDGGKSWSRLKNCPWYKLDSDGFDSDWRQKKISALCIDPNNADIWFVGGGNTVRGQQCFGVTYEDLTCANPHGNPAQFGGKIWRTTDAGKTWNLVNSGLDSNAQIVRIIVNPLNSNQVFLGTNFGVYRSDNGGNSWTQVSKKYLDSDIVMDMDFYCDVEKKYFVLYVIDQIQYFPDGDSVKCAGGIFFSLNGGKVWKKINGNIALDYNRLTGDARGNFYMYLSKWFGLTSREVMKKYPKIPTSALQAFNNLAVDPSKPGRIYVGFPDPQTGNSIVPGRLWVTENNGKTWINTARLYEDTWGKDKVYWEERGNPWNQNMKVTHFSPHQRHGRNYALRSMRGLGVGVDGSVMMISDHSTMLSTDHGQTWNQVDEHYTPSGAIIGNGNSNLPGLTIAQDKRLQSTILGSGEHRVWIPTYDDPDGEIALKYIPSASETISSIAFNPYNPKIAYATSERQSQKQYMIRSTDGGNTWAIYGVATPATNKWLDDFYTKGLIIDPVDPNYMYLGITKIADPKKANMGGFFRSEDGGKTFKQSNDGLPLPARVNDIAFDPRDNSMNSIYIACQYCSFKVYGPLTHEAGLYYSSDRGSHWEKVSLPESIKGVNCVKFDNTGRMYITTGYRGGGDGLWFSDDYGKNWSQIFKYANTDCFDVSPFDINMIVVSVGEGCKNPGVYMSRDRGATWEKCNKIITIPHKVVDVKFDILHRGEIWLATLGCGYYKGIIKDAMCPVEVEPQTAYLKLGGKLALGVKGNERIVWKSENKKIAFVSSDGLVKARGNGLVKIWATTPDGRYSDFCSITVEKQP